MNAPKPFRWMLRAGCIYLGVVVALVLIGVPLPSSATVIIGGVFTMPLLAGGILLSKIDQVELDRLGVNLGHVASLIGERIKR